MGTETYRWSRSLFLFRLTWSLFQSHIRARKLHKKFLTRSIFFKSPWQGTIKPTQRRLGTGTCPWSRSFFLFRATWSLFQSHTGAQKPQKVLDRVNIFGNVPDRVPRNTSKSKNFEFLSLLGWYKILPFPVPGTVDFQVCSSKSPSITKVSTPCGHKARKRWIFYRKRPLCMRKYSGK